jgi:AcrR family transcriptional regulator
MIEDELLIAYADGECSDADRKLVEQALADDPALRERLEQHRRLAARVAAHFAPIAEAPVPDRLAALLQKQEADVIDFVAAKENREKRRRLPGWGNFGAIAASLAVGVLAGQMALPGRGGVVQTHEGALIARGDLAKALDVQLASAQDTGANVRIGVSFQDKAGQYCRSFETGGLAGIGCRDGDRWRLPVTHSASDAAGQTGYRQASSGDALVMETATGMMLGAPLDAATERKVRDNGWR